MWAVRDSAGASDDCREGRTSPLYMNGIGSIETRIKFRSRVILHITDDKFPDENFHFIMLIPSIRIAHHNLKLR
jgi:hypothetical protein